jgi:Ca2+-binding RTX toxin-like protein
MNSHGTLTITFNNNATQSITNQVLSSIAYSNSSNNPSTLVTINWTFNDGNTGTQGTGGALTDMGSTTLHITRVNDLPTGSVSLAGQTLTASNTLADADGIGAITYTWKSGTTVLETGATHVVTATDIGTAISVTASYTDLGGTHENVTSATMQTGTNNADTLTGGTGSNILYGLAGNDTLNGGTGKDTLDGGAGNDILLGGSGNDALTGGTGQDIFRFNTALSANNIDTITDFVVVDDTIQLENAIFTQLTATGVLSSANFSISTAATTATDFIFYNTNTDALFYDSDGNGAGAAVQIAVLGVGGNLALTNADFIVT